VTVAVWNGYLRHFGEHQLVKKKKSANARPLARQYGAACLKIDRLKIRRASSPPGELER